MHRLHRRAFLQAAALAPLGASAQPLPAAAALQVDARLQAILDEMRSPEKEIRLKAISKLVHYEGGEDAKIPALDALRGAMKDREPEVRAVACTATGNMRERASRAVPDLTRLLKDPDREVRQCAVRALGRVGQPALISLKAIRASTADSDPVVRVVAHGSLVRLGQDPSQHMPALIEGMHSADALLRYKSAHSCEPLGAAAAPAVEHIARLLTDENEQVRHYAARALVNLGETARPALPALRAAQKSERVKNNLGLIDAAIRKLEAR